MATVWSPVDPTDIVDLWFDFKPLIASGLTIATQTVTAPPEVTLVGTPAVDGQKVRFRQGPSQLGQHLVKGHVVLNNGEERDMESTLTVKERVIRP